VTEHGDVDLGDRFVVEASCLGKRYVAEIGGDGAPIGAPLPQRRLRAEQRNGQDDCIFFATTTTMAMMAARRIRRFIATA